MDELDNPYRPGVGTSPPALLGRDEQIDHLGAAVRRAVAGRPGRSLIPSGLRGVGKTVLLNRFAEIAEIAEHEGLAVGFVEATQSGEFREQLANRLRRILLAFDNQNETARVLKVLRVLKTFTLQLPDGSKVLLGVDPLAGSADSGNLSDDVTDLLVVAGETAAQRHTWHGPSRVGFRCWGHLSDSRVAHEPRLLRRHVTGRGFRPPPAIAVLAKTQAAHGLVV